MTVSFAAPAKKALIVLAAVGAATTLSGCGAIINGLQAAQQQEEAPPADIPSAEPPTTAESVPAAEEDTAAFDIAVGDCLNDESVVGEVSEVPTVSCADAHDSEVYATVDASGSTWPGQTAVEQEADDFCYAEFTSFTGVAYESSLYEYTYYTPTEDAFDSFQREIACVIYDPSGQTTGTLSGIGA